MAHSDDSTWQHLSEAGYLTWEVSTKPKFAWRESKQGWCGGAGGGGSVLSCCGVASACPSVGHPGP